MLARISSHSANVFSAMMPATISPAEGALAISFCNVLNRSSAISSGWPAALLNSGQQRPGCSIENRIQRSSDVRYAPTNGLRAEPCRGTGGMPPVCMARLAVISVAQVPIPAATRR